MPGFLLYVAARVALSDPDPLSMDGEVSFNTTTAFEYLHRAQRAWRIS
ncbi:hypothetical protein QEZ47_03310 [Aminobacter anthyllidis]|nr:hypothetical protein [Aminobacter anthyllidis]MDH4984595.1 hypothetical protein [Aminobacter anthyllidis]